MDALEALRDHGAHPEQLGALRRPVARGAGAVLLAGEHDQRHPLLLVAHRRVVDRQLLAVRQVHRHTAFGQRRSVGGPQQVADADVGEGAAHHHLVVAAARAEGVEVARRHPLLLQVEPGGPVALDRARGGDVVGGDGVAPHRQHARACRSSTGCGLWGHPLEVGGQARVGGALVPGEAIAGGDVQAVPVLVAGEHLGVALAEHVRLHRRLDRLRDLAPGGPDVAQVDVAGPRRRGRAGRRRCRCPSCPPARTRRTAAGRRGSSSSRRG